MFPFYHAVSDKKIAHLNHLYTPRTIQQFKADLDFLQKHYASISLAQLLLLNDTDLNAKKYFHLSFDDGLSEFYSIVAPILKERNIHTTVFLNTDFVDNKAMFYRLKASLLFEVLKEEELLSISYQNKGQLDELAVQHGIDFNAYLKKKKPYLTSEQIKELIGQGFTFGAHSLDHPLYNKLTIEEQLRQTKQSVDWVTSQFKLDYKAFSFPFTDDGVSNAFFSEISNEVDMTFGCAGLKDESINNHFQRIPMETKESGEKIIKTEYQYYLLKKKVGKNKIVRQ